MSSCSWSAAPLPIRTGRIGNGAADQDRKSTRLNSSHSSISYAVFCLKKKKSKNNTSKQTRKNTTYLHKQKLIESVCPPNYRLPSGPDRLLLPNEYPCPRCKSYDQKCT